MTREEAIKGLTSLVEVRRKYVGMQTMKDEIECLDMAIKALEQEPILDKIRAEVKALPNANPSYSGYIDVVDREDVLEIIDKYKAESEDNFGMYKGWAKKRESVYKKLGYAIYAKEEEK